MVNMYDKAASFKFLEDLNAKLNSDKSENSDSSLTKIISGKELEAIVGIVEFQVNFFLHPFKYDNNKEGFAVYNANDKASINSNNPILKLTQDNVSGLDIYRLNNIAMSEDNLFKASTISGLDTRDQYYTKTGMPKQYRGMKLKTVLL
jgi:hypothetical protein